MSEALNGPFNSLEGVAEEIWSVVVLYEDKPTRDRAMGVCDRLVANFLAEVTFDFRWWRTDFLNEPRMAQTAAADAATADIIIFSSHAESSLSPTLLHWFKGWTGRREQRPGMLLDLSDALEHSSLPGPHKQWRLREIAQLAGLDYFNRVPPRLGGDVTKSWDDMQARTTEVTGLLDGILKTLPPPPHFGLNE